MTKLNEFINSSHLFFDTILRDEKKLTQIYSDSRYFATTIFMSGVYLLYIFFYLTPLFIFIHNSMIGAIAFAMCSIPIGIGGFIYVIPPLFIHILNMFRSDYRQINMDSTTRYKKKQWAKLFKNTSHIFLIISACGLLFAAIAFPIFLLSNQELLIFKYISTAGIMMVIAGILPLFIIITEEYE